ncbi:MAG: HAMP domain-containing histidine kinase [Phyllobacteriaceae bacterium]|jgi:signal transduction histidine kinase|nr:HAMP domain-containing histidine kinase [Phyllobacteriaceae bacterium]
MKLRLFGLTAILATTVLLSTAILLQWKTSHELAREEFIKDAKAETRNEAVVIERAFRSIYENLRTLSSLPGVRELDRHGTNITTEAKVTIQQVYNNLASSVSVSEVYFTPIDFDPDKIDPVTAKREEPALMFDELVLNAGLKMTHEERFNSPEAVKAATTVGPDEVETFEYIQLKDHAAWLKANAATLSAKGTLDVPFIAGPEVITCDNTVYVSSHWNPDRSGIIFSVPYYGVDGELRGMVSAIILTTAIKELIHKGQYALVNTGNSYLATSPSSTIPASALVFAQQSRPDPTLIYSETIAFGVRDWRNPWTIWAGLPNSEFAASKNAILADRTRNTNLLVVGLLTAAALGGLLVSDRLLRQSNALAENARAKGAEAVEAAEHLQALNDDVTRLNLELSTKIKQLSDAQDEIISKGKMAQLGQLVAMVAHEIRNPLGGIRTAAFLLRRKLAAANIDHDSILGRVESGIARCDNIITQLLDFSRSSKPSVELIVLDDWMEKILEEEASSIPAAVNITCNLGLGGASCEFDSQRLRRAIINLVSNAYEAMMDSNKVLSNCVGGVPSISITTRKTGRGVEIEIEDNGPGMTADVLARIREPLFTTKSFGTGLGVPAVEKIAELHGGGLDVATVVGRGTRFTLWMPMRQSSDHQQRAA